MYVSSTVSSHVGCISVGDDVMDDSISNALGSIGALVERDSNNLIQNKENGASIVCEMIEAVQHNPRTLRKTIGGVANSENRCVGQFISRGRLHAHEYQ